MIYQICNINNEQVATFYKAAIIKKDDITYFNHLTSDDDIETLITNLPDTITAFITDLLPENIALPVKSQIDGSGIKWRVACNFTVTPQDKNLQSYLDTFNNTEVVLLLYKYGATYIYGNSLTPLLFSYDEQHDNSGDGSKGYVVGLNGDILGSTKILEEVELNIFTRGLAFTLAGSL